MKKIGNNKEAVIKLGELSGFKVCSDYSGRGMFGKTCWGITIDKEDKGEIIEKAIELGLHYPSIDDMGRGLILYWENIN